MESDSLQILKLNQDQEALEQNKHDEDQQQQNLSHSNSIKLEDSTPNKYQIVIDQELDNRFQENTTDQNYNNNQQFDIQNDRHNSRMRDEMINQIDFQQQNISREGAQNFQDIGKNSQLEDLRCATEELSRNRVNSFQLEQRDNYYAKNKTNTESYTLPTPEDFTAHTTQNHLQFLHPLIKNQRDRALKILMEDCESERRQYENKWQNFVNVMLSVYEEQDQIIGQLKQEIDQKQDNQERRRDSNQSKFKVKSQTMIKNQSSKGFQTHLDVKVQQAVQGQNQLINPDQQFDKMQSLFQSRTERNQRFQSINTTQQQSRLSSMRRATLQNTLKNRSHLGSSKNHSSSSNRQKIAAHRHSLRGFNNLNPKYLNPQQPQSKSQQQTLLFNVKQQMQTSSVTFQNQSYKSKQGNTKTDQITKLDPDQFILELRQQLEFCNRVIEKDRLDKIKLIEKLREMKKEITELKQNREVQIDSNFKYEQRLDTEHSRSSSKNSTSRKPRAQTEELSPVQELINKDTSPSKSSVKVQTDNFLSSNTFNKVGNETDKYSIGLNTSLQEMNNPSPLDIDQIKPSSTQMNQSYSASKLNTQQQAAKVMMYDEFEESRLRENINFWKDKVDLLLQEKKEALHEQMTQHKIIRNYESQIEELKSQVKQKEQILDNIQIEQKINSTRVTGQYQNSKQFNFNQMEIQDQQENDVDHDDDQDSEGNINEDIDLLQEQDMKEEFQSLIQQHQDQESIQMYQKFIDDKAAALLHQRESVLSEIEQESMDKPSIRILSQNDDSNVGLRYGLNNLNGMMSQFDSYAPLQDNQTKIKNNLKQSLIEREHKKYVPDESQINQYSKNFGKNIERNNSSSKVERKVRQTKLYSVQVETQNSTEQSPSKLQKKTQSTYIDNNIQKQRHQDIINRQGLNSISQKFNKQQRSIGPTSTQSQNYQKSHQFKHPIKDNNTDQAVSIYQSTLLRHQRQISNNLAPVLGTSRDLSQSGTKNFHIQDEDIDKSTQRNPLEYTQNHSNFNLNQNSSQSLSKIPNLTSFISSKQNQQVSQTSSTISNPNNQSLKKTKAQSQHTTQSRKGKNISQSKIRTSSNSNKKYKQNTKQYQNQYPPQKSQQVLQQRADSRSKNQVEKQERVQVIEDSKNMNLIEAIIQTINQKSNQKIREDLEQKNQQQNEDQRSQFIENFNDQNQTSNQIISPHISVDLANNNFTIDRSLTSSTTSHHYQKSNSTFQGTQARTYQSPMSHAQSILNAYKIQQPNSRSKPQDLAQNIQKTLQQQQKYLMTSFAEYDKLTSSTKFSKRNDPNLSQQLLNRSTVSSRLNNNNNNNQQEKKKSSMSQYNIIQNAPKHKYRSNNFQQNNFTRNREVDQSLNMDIRTQELITQIHQGNSDSAQDFKGSNNLTNQLDVSAFKDQNPLNTTSNNHYSLKSLKNNQTLDSQAFQASLRVKGQNFEQFYLHQPQAVNASTLTQQHNIPSNKKEFQNNNNSNSQSQTYFYNRESQKYQLNDDLIRENRKFNLDQMDEQDYKQLDSYQSEKSPKNRDINTNNNTYHNQIQEDKNIQNRSGKIYIESQESQSSLNSQKLQQQSAIAARQLRSNFQKIMAQTQQDQIQRQTEQTTNIYNQTAYQEAKIKDYISQNNTSNREKTGKFNNQQMIKSSVTPQALDSDQDHYLDQYLNKDFSGFGSPNMNIQNTNSNNNFLSRDRTQDSNSNFGANFSAQQQQILYQGSREISQILPQQQFNVSGNAQIIFNNHNSNSNSSMSIASPHTNFLLTGASSNMSLYPIIPLTAQTQANFNNLNFKSPSQDLVYDNYIKNENNGIHSGSNYNNFAVTQANLQVNNSNTQKNSSGGINQNNFKNNVHNQYRFNGKASQVNSNTNNINNMSSSNNVKSTNIIQNQAFNRPNTSSGVKNIKF